MNQVINKQKCPNNTQVSIGGGRRFGLDSFVWKILLIAFEYSGFFLMVDRSILRSTRQEPVQISLSFDVLSWF